VYFVVAIVVVVVVVVVARVDLRGAGFDFAMGVRLPRLGGARDGRGDGLAAAAREGRVRFGGWDRLLVNCDYEVENEAYHFVLF